MKDLILGIESSCDDSSVALFDTVNFKIIHHEKISQELEHSKFGGVVPELAARLHTAALPKLAENILEFLPRVAAVAVTNEPGLSVSLIGGVSMAKALSLALEIPIIGVNHLIGHIYSLFLEDAAQFPMGILLVSGGHTMILDISNSGEIAVLAKTSDDSFGESFDKVAKMLNLGYPGGKVIENLAREGEDKFHFTVPLLHDKRLEFSFSGLKNQVRLTIAKCAEDGKLEANLSDISCSFQTAAIAHIMDKLKRIYAEKKWAKFGVVGGASANLALRSEIQNLAQIYGSALYFAPLEYCSDNAAMIARAGFEKYKNGEFDEISALKINPKCKFD